jgi:hypothetical protein
MQLMNSVILSVFLNYYKSVGFGSKKIKNRITLNICIFNLITLLSI